MCLRPPCVVAPVPRRRREPAGRPSAAGHDGASARRRHRLRPTRHPTRLPPHRAREHRRGTPPAGRTSSRSPWHGRCRSRRRRRTGGSASRCRRSSAAYRVPSGSSSNVSSSVSSSSTGRLRCRLRRGREQHLDEQRCRRTCRAPPGRRAWARARPRATACRAPHPGTAVWRLAALISVMSAPRTLEPDYLVRWIRVAPMRSSVFRWCRPTSRHAAPFGSVHPSRAPSPSDLWPQRVRTATPPFDFEPSIQPVGTYV